MFARDRLDLKLTRLERKLDLIMKHLGIPDPTPATDWSDIDDLIRRGKLVHAIKCYRDQNQEASLVDAKDAVEDRARQLG
ncbi:hypothetical protein [Nocardia lijiangensis]|uniref:hypothetical protein n=1 Tax=Nocardia lijiangensis TaxID=299618 RepID=UPI000830D944|nr:hypothetical protein [Nocardia lijiangensis]